MPSNPDQVYRGKGSALAGATSRGSTERRRRTMSGTQVSEGLCQELKSAKERRDWSKSGQRPQDYTSLLILTKSTGTKGDCLCFLMGQ